MTLLKMMLWLLLTSPTHIIAQDAIGTSIKALSKHTKIKEFERNLRMTLEDNEFAFYVLWFGERYWKGNIGKSVYKGSNIKVYVIYQFRKGNKASCILDWEF